eukprot:553514_1
MRVTFLSLIIILQCSYADTLIKCQKREKEHLMHIEAKKHDIEDLHHDYAAREKKLMAELHLQAKQLGDEFVAAQHGGIGTPGIKEIRRGKELEYIKARHPHSGTRIHAATSSEREESVEGMKKGGKVMHDVKLPVRGSTTETKYKPGLFKKKTEKAMEELFGDYYGYYDDASEEENLDVYGSNKQPSGHRLRRKYQRNFY